MGFLKDGFEKTAALCVGMATITYGSPSGTIESVTAAAGIAAFVLARRDRFGSECDRISKNIRKRVRRNWEAELVNDGGELSASKALEEADRVFQRSVNGIALSAEEMGGATVSRFGFIHRARWLLMQKLSVCAPDVYGPEQEGSFAYRYAEDVLRAGLESAVENPDYYRHLEPSIIFAMTRAVGEILDETRDTAGSMRVLASQIAALREDWAERRVSSSHNETAYEGLSPELTANLAQFGIVAERLTKDQFRVLDYLRRTRRVRISGCAGSGKTIVACEKATRMVRAGLSTLFVCHSPFLADFVRTLLAGSGVAVSSFANLISDLTGAQDGGEPWSIFEQPTSDQLNSAFEVAASGRQYFDAIIVDEGQDFEESWWLIVEALLREGSAGTLYIFHDDHQSLHVGRSTYPIADPVIDLTRNCRSSSAVLSIVGALHPAAPAMEFELEHTGFVWAMEERGLSPRGKLEAALVLALRSGFCPEQIVAVPLGGFEVELLKGRDAAIDLQTDETWQSGILRQFSALSHSSQYKWIFDGPGPENVREVVLRLSDAASPTFEDKRKVAALVGQFALDPKAQRYIDANASNFPPLKWIRQGASLDISGRLARATNDVELLHFFSSDEWSRTLPPPTRVWVSAQPDRRERSVLRLLEVGEIKGLEFDIVILLVGDRKPVTLTEKYIAASRSRFGLILCDEDHKLRMKSSHLRVFDQVTDRRLRNETPNVGSRSRFSR